MESDPFDELLDLENKFYDEGYQLGTIDGAKAGRAEGRAFGLEKGFEKYAENGKLHGRSQVWISRMPRNETTATNSCYAIVGSKSEDTVPPTKQDPHLSPSLPVLPYNPRLEKHLRVLFALTEPASLSTDNSENSISDFDDRFKRAQGKLKIVERLVSEEGVSSAFSHGASGGPTGHSSSGGAGAGIEDVDILKARH